jgi:hypothetical protein
MNEMADGEEQTRSAQPMKLSNGRLASWCGGEALALRRPESDLASRCRTALWHCCPGTNLIPLFGW